MESEQASAESSSSNSSRRSRNKTPLRFQEGSQARYEVDVKLLSDEEMARVNAANLTSKYFDTLSKGLSVKLQDYLASTECASAQTVRNLDKPSFHYVSDREFFVSFKNPMCSEEFARGRVFFDLRELGKSLIEQGFATLGFSYLGAACQMVAAFPQNFVNRAFYDTAQEAARLVLDEASTGLKFSRKRLPAPVVDTFKNAAARLKIKEHVFLDFLNPERDENADAADFAWILTALGLSASDASSIAKNASYEERSGWLALLNAPDIDLPKQSCQKPVLSASRRQAGSTLIEGSNVVLRSAWSATPEAGLFMACLLREVANKAEIARPPSFYDCLIECIDKKTPTGISDYCKACIPNFKNRIGKMRTALLLALPTLKPTTTPSKSNTTSSGSTTTTTTTSTAPNQKSTGGKQS